MASDRQGCIGWGLPRNPFAEISVFPRNLFAGFSAFPRNLFAEIPAFPRNLFALYSGLLCSALFFPYQVINFYPDDFAKDGT